MNKIDKLRNILKQENLTSFLVPSHDEFMNEYTPPHLKRLKWLTGFTGSNGIAIITLKEAIFFTDGRYITQSKLELDPNIWKIYNLQDKKPYEWANENNITISYDPKLHINSDIKNFKSSISTFNLIDQIWREDRSQPETKIFDYSNYTKQSSQLKIEKLSEAIKTQSADYFLITDPESVCWLLNIRGNDIPYLPVVLCYGLASKDGEVETFKLDEVSKLDKFENKTILIDENQTAIYFIELLKQKNIIKFAPNPCYLWKAIKDEKEIEHIKEIHILDGIAVTKFLKFVKENIPISEIELSERLEEFRKEEKRFLYPSFPSISAAGANGAIIHYHPTEESNKILENNMVYLIDSGGQYLGGTTDVTRVLKIGTSSMEEKEIYTRVLKGHIALASAIFPYGTRGCDLDILARQFLWEINKDYDHGTGHGVGNCLNVHEGPQRISKIGTHILEPGMILSNEPGYYEVGKYGMRIENLMLVKQHSKKFLCFETITLVPLEESLIDQDLLTEKEKQWIKDYHEKIDQLIQY